MESHSDGDVFNLLQYNVRYIRTLLEEGDEVLWVLKQEGELSVLRSYRVPPQVLLSFLQFKLLQICHSLTPLSN